jgi:hypothetical protein
MANDNVIDAAATKANTDVRSKFTGREIALLADLIELHRGDYRAVAARFDAR